MATFANLTVNDTGYLQLPNGTGAQRPTAATGMIRYNSSRSEMEVYNGNVWISLQNFPTNIVTNGIVLYLDSGNSASYSGTGTTWVDLSGSNNTGTLVNGPSFTATNQGYLTFDGANDYVNIPSSTSINPSTGLITTMAWFYSTAEGTENGSIILNKENEYEISAGGGYVTYAFRPNWAWVGRTAYNINIWNCVTITYDQSYQRMYLNGTEVYSASQSGAIGNIYANDLRIAARGAPDAAYGFFAGRIPMVLIYNRALSSAEVKQNFLATAGRFNRLTPV